MSDIVERLRKVERVERELAHDCDMPPEWTANWEYAETCREAAAEIERLRALLKEAGEEPITSAEILARPTIPGVADRDALVEKVAKEICREKCAFYGEPPCWDLGDEYVQKPWPPDCDEPGCLALATAAIAALKETKND